MVQQHATAIEHAAGRCPERRAYWQLQRQDQLGWLQRCACPASMHRVKRAAAAGKRCCLSAARKSSPCQHKTIECGFSSTQPRALLGTSGWRLTAKAALVSVYSTSGKGCQPLMLTAAASPQNEKGELLTLIQQRPEAEIVMLFIKDFGLDPSGQTWSYCLNACRLKNPYAKQSI